MTLKVPPGRAGRRWLARRRVVADRAADLLEQKRRALLGEQRRLRLLADRTERAFRDAAVEADRWLGRAAVVGGPRAVAQAAARVPATAEVAVTWRTTMGAVYPARIACRFPPVGAPASAGQAAALGPAAAASRRAVEAAAQHAAARTAIDRVDAELAVTVRRLRLIERRWIPTLDTQMHDLQVRLDEHEREDLIAIRWTQEHGRAHRDAGRGSEAGG